MSQAEPRSAERPLKGLGIAVLFGLVLMALCFLRRLGDTGSAAFNNGFLDNMLEAGLWGTALGRNIALFALTLSLLHIAFGIACWLLARLSGYAFPKASTSHLQLFAIWAICLTAWLLIANAALFPFSSLGQAYAEAVRAGGSWFNLFNIATALLLCALAGLTILSLRRVIAVKRASRKPGVPAVVMVCAALGALGIAGAYAAHSGQPALSKPHVIIIGIDSLRYDVASARGPGALAPNVRAFLDNGVSFSDAITPLARTFPAWVSILTGKDPHTTGAIVNLLPRSLVDTGDTLGDLYRRAGYRTAYGIDEVRFSNIDTSYGFDQAITPPIGASDFLLAWFGDTPLSNLMVNSRFGALAFPNLYANRAVPVLYDPDEFVARLDRNLRFDQPTFLAVHLTLPHWPYGWSRSPSFPMNEAAVRQLYGKAVQRVDQQLHDILAVLERRGALKNAVVVLLSDHGEGLGQADDLLIPQGGLLGEYDTKTQSLGHGTSVISPHQIQVVLAMRTFGAASLRVPRGKLIDAPVSLEDLAPTLTEISGLAPRGPFDGQSLLPLVRSDPAATERFWNRVRFTETEFNPKGVAIGIATTTSAIANAAMYYRVDPVTDHLEVRPQHIGDVLHNRQYAAVLGQELLAAIPRDAEVGLYDLYFMGRDGADAHKAVKTPSADTEPQHAKLWQALHDRLGLASAIELKTDAKP